MIQGLVTAIDVPADHKETNSQYTLSYQEYAPGSSAGVPKKMNVDVIIGADGANSCVAKAMDAGRYNFAIAFRSPRSRWSSTRRWRRCTSVTM